MRLILSRKGFDSGAGGCPSPIFPDGSMLALPIPDKRSPIRYCDLSWRDWNVGDLVERLTRGKQRRDHRAHLDPDLREGGLSRHDGWRPSLGQTGQAQAHLRNEAVAPGDLFLFFGLFRRVDGDLRPVGPPLHVLWGWLQVGTVLSVDATVRVSPHRWPWLNRHPHLAFERDPLNTIYVAADTLRLTAPHATSVPAAGVFDSFVETRRLTAAGASTVSEWELPRAFLPGGRRPLTFHGDAKRWAESGDRVRLRSVARGQEFVLDLDEYPDVSSWLPGIFGDSSPGPASSPARRPSRTRA